MDYVLERLELVAPNCLYCNEPLSVMKGGPQVNGLHGKCAEDVSEEMDAAYGPIDLVVE